MHSLEDISFSKESSGVFNILSKDPIFLQTNVCKLEHVLAADFSSHGSVVWDVHCFDVIDETTIAFLQELTSKCFDPVNGQANFSLSVWCEKDAFQSNQIKTIQLKRITEHPYVYSFSCQVVSDDV